MWLISLIFNTNITNRHKLDIFSRSYTFRQLLSSVIHVSTVTSFILNKFGIGRFTFVNGHIM